MPCHNASHTHEWPRSSALSIAKCESRCGFCTSNKYYKPASTLRKIHNHRIISYRERIADILMQHVLTHIKNDEMPLTLEKSTGGRPTLQTTTNVPVGNDQPELPPSHSENPEVTAATNLAIEKADVEGGTIRHVDTVFDFLRDTFATREVEYNEQVALIVQSIQSGEEAVHLLKSIGSGQRLFQQALDHLKIHLIEIDSDDWFTWLEEPRDGDRWFWVQIERSYSAFLRVMQGTIQSLSSTIVQEMFYAGVILFVTQGILYDSGSTPGGPVLEVTEGNSSTTEYACPSHGPILLVLGESKKRLYDLFDDAYGINFFAGLREMDSGDLLPNWNFIVVANMVPKSGTVITLAEIAERLNELIDQFMSKWGLADSIL